MVVIGSHHLLLVNSGRIVTQLFRVNFDPPGGWLSVAGLGGRGDAAEVFVFEPVGVSFQADDFGVVDEPVDHGGCHDVVAEDFAPAIRRACWR